MGGREVGEFGLDSAVASSGKKGKNNSEPGGRGANGDKDGTRLGAHGIRVGDIVRVEDTAGGGRGGGKGAKYEDKESKALEGVVTRVGERSVWVAFGDKGPGGGGGQRRDDDDSVEDLWGKKVWL